MVTYVGVVTCVTTGLNKKKLHQHPLTLLCTTTQPFEAKRLEFKFFLNLINTTHYIQIYTHLAFSQLTYLHTIMACKLPHTVEELQRFIKNETENRDVDRQNAIVEVIKKLEAAKQQKERLRERYGECTDISDDRKYVIDTFLYDEYRKEAAVIESLWVCVNQIQAEISNKIRWSFEENVESGKVEQQQHQQQQQQQGASSSSAPRFVVQ